jgi:hypothetical protein
MAEAKKPYKRSLRNYLLNLRYQMKYTLTIVGISLVLTGGLGYVVISKAHEASRVVQVRAMDPTDELAQQLVTQFAANDRVMMVVLIIFGAVLCLVLTAYGIVITHKVAGPLYKVTLYLQKMRDGKMSQVYNLRKGDELVEFFGHFKDAHDAMRKRIQDDVALLEDAIAAAPDGPVKEKLKAARDAKVESLK